MTIIISIVDLHAAKLVVEVLKFKLGVLLLQYFCIPCLSTNTFVCFACLPDIFHGFPSPPRFIIYWLWLAVLTSAGYKFTCTNFFLNQYTSLK